MPTKTKRLLHSIDEKLKHNKDGSYQTQACRRRRLHQCGRDLIKGGYQLGHINGLKRKHIEYLVKHWHELKLSQGTIKNRMSDIRWISETMNKAGIVPKNDSLDIERRIYVRKHNAC